MIKVLFGLIVGVLITILTLGFVTGAPRLPGLDSLKRFWSAPSVQKAQTPATLWTTQARVANGEVEVTAWGAAATEDSRNRAHAVALALRTARHLAYEQLAEYLKGARTAGQSHYHGDVLQQAQLTSQTLAVIRGARIVKEEVKELPDGSVRAVVTVRHPLTKPTAVKKAA